MSTTTIRKVEVTNERFLKTAVELLGGEYLGYGQHHMWDGDKQGYGVFLPDACYPIVFDLKGEMLYDSDMNKKNNHLNRLLQEYALAVCSDYAVQNNMSCIFERNTAGKIEVILGEEENKPGYDIQY